MKYLPYALDLTGALLAYALWKADMITLWGVASIIVTTAIISTMVHVGSRE